VADGLEKMRFSAALAWPHVSILAYPETPTDAQLQPQSSLTTRPEKGI
jgi:hypothetical protein